MSYLERFSSLLALMPALRTAFSSFHIKRLRNKVESSCCFCLWFECSLKKLNWCDTKPQWKEVPSLSKQKTLLITFLVHQRTKSQKKTASLLLVKLVFTKATTYKCRRCSRKPRRRGERCRWFNCWNTWNKIWTDIASEWLVSQGMLRDILLPKGRAGPQKPSVEHTQKMSLYLS